jgi:ParB family chromosome partitioning protein
MQARDKKETSISLAKRYEEHARGQRAFVRELRTVQEALTRLDRNFRRLLADEHFVTLLRAEGLERIPSALLKRTQA